MPHQNSIAIVCSSPGFGGLEMNTLKIAQWLEQQGWQVRLLVNEASKLHNQARQICKDVTSLQQLKPGTISTTVALIRKWLKDKNASILFTPYNKDIKVDASV